MRVLGIDPGTAIVGYGVIDYEKGKFHVVNYGCIYTPKDLPMEDRLVKIHEDLSALIEKYQPEEMAVEELFYFKNNKTVISVRSEEHTSELQSRQYLVCCPPLEK